MSKHTVRAACGGVLVSFSVLALAFPASASPFTLNDNYSGGTNYYPTNAPSDLDVIQDSNTNVFQITGANVSRLDSNTLVVQINTYFAGVPGNANVHIANLADGTTYGSLFLTSQSNWNPIASGDGHYSTDTFPTTNTKWTYAVTTTNPGLYAIAGTPIFVASSQNSSVPQYYTTTDGKIVMSNVGGNPVSYPNSGAPGYYFRQSQAVQYDPTDPNAIVTTIDGHTAVSVAITPSTFNVNLNGTLASNFAQTEGSIKYTITDDGIFGNSFALAWAMTCANDAIQGLVTLTPNHGESFSPTPLPAAFPLFAGGLGVIALSSRKRKKQIANLAA